MRRHSAAAVAEGEKVNQPGVSLSLSSSERFLACPVISERQGAFERDGEKRLLRPSAVIMGFAPGTLPGERKRKSERHSRLLGRAAGETQTTLAR